MRGVRLAMTHPDLLDEQLAALAEAGREAEGIAVMAPMVATPEEADWFADRVRASGGGNVEIGVMVEVPSAVLCAEELAERLDFLSIGTNDLAQYVHAADRREAQLSGLQDPFHPALLRSVGMVCRAGADKRAWVGVCGEAASDPAWALLAVGMGVGELSMSAESILEVRAAIARRSYEECRAAAAEALRAPDAGSARAVALSLLQER